MIVATADCCARLSGNLKTMRPGSKINVGGIEIEAVPAYNLNKQFHTKERDGSVISLVLEVTGYTWPVIRTI